MPDFSPQRSTNGTASDLAELDRRLEDWVPDLVGTLVFIERAEDVLLIRKLTGHGAGRINAPGGKLEPGESLAECAQREVYEEVGLTIPPPKPMAVLRFVSTTSEQWLGHAFVTETFSGSPRPSAEADPFWCPLARLPLDEMWPDDAYWLPRVLQGERLAGDFLFTGEALLAHRIGPWRCDSSALDRSRARS